MLAAADGVLQLLLSCGVAAIVDNSESRTPGQKYRLWEERKVRARIEIGPKDSLSQQCILAEASSIPGELASKQTYKVFDALLSMKPHSVCANVGLHSCWVQEQLNTHNLSRPCHTICMQMYEAYCR